MLKFIPQHEFTINVLLYGDHPNLAKRCLNSIRALNESYILFVAMNAVCDETRDYVASIHPDLVIDNKKNEMKYPVMKKMIESCRSDYFMWFDDDSYITKPDDFLKNVKSTNGDIVGWIYTSYLRGKQREWIQKQPWYQGVKISDPVKFIQGSWWTAKTDFLRKSGWPWKQILHRGGDMSLGFWIEQNQSKMEDFQNGIAFNMAARRGFDEQLVGFLG